MMRGHYTSVMGTKKHNLEDEFHGREGGGGEGYTSQCCCYCFVLLVYHLSEGFKARLESY